MEKGKIVEIARTTKRIKSKRVVSNCDVYDLGMESNHNFIANGINVHNCTEALLPDNGNCNLGSINLTRMYDEETKDVDWSLLAKVINISVRMMDNVLTMNIYPTSATKIVAERSRRIGLGVMGLHHLLIKMGLRYGSEESIEFIERLFATIRNEAFKSSIEIAKDKGSFPEYDYEKYCDNGYVKSLPSRLLKSIKKFGIRNAVILSIAPTGTISMVAGTSSGIEPIFSPMYNRKYRIGNTLAEEVVVDSMFGIAVESGKWDHIVGAYDVTPEEHMAVQAAVQDYVDQAISKCVVEGTKLNTNRGTYNIENLAEIPDDVLIVDKFYPPKYEDLTIIDEFGYPQNIKSVYYGGEKNCVLVTMSNGLTIKCSHNHKFKTSNGWVKSIELCDGDRVFYRTDPTYCVGDLIEIDQPKFPIGGNSFEYPKHMTEDFAKLIGMWHSDGYASKNSIGIVEKNDEVGDLVDDLFMKCFGVIPKITVDKRSGVKTHYLNSRGLVRHFVENFGKDCVTKKIPNSIFESNDDIIINYLIGLTLDGYRCGKKMVVYDGYSHNIANGSISLLARLGLKYYFGSKRVPTGLKSKVSYQIAVYDNEQPTIVPIEAHKLSLDSGKCFIQRYIDPNLRDKILDDIGCGSKESYIRRNFKRSMDMCDGFISEETLNLLGVDNYDSSLSCVKVVSVEHIGKHKVWDIEVDESHSYIINGIVSHNTVNVPETYTHEELMELILNYSDRLKGLTIYREGSRENEPLQAIKTTKANVEKYAMNEELMGVVNEGCAQGSCEL